MASTREMERFLNSLLPGEHVHMCVTGEHLWGHASVVGCAAGPTVMDCPEHDDPRNYHQGPPQNERQYYGICGQAGVKTVAEYYAFSKER